MLQKYDFTTGIETAAAPATSTPSADADLITLAFADARYARGVADVATLKAIGATRRAEDLPIWVDSLKAWFIFDADDTQTGDDVNIITPTSGSGRWLRMGGKTKFTIADNQSSAQNVTGLSFDKTKTRSFVLRYTVYRSASGGSTRSQSGLCLFVTDGTNWDYAQGPDVGDAGVVLSITSAGQVQYTSDANGGSYDANNSWMKYEIADVTEV